VRLDELLASVREPWMRDALCHEYPLRLFFPESGQSTEHAKAICGRCLVKAECLDYALRNPYARDHGVWAGTTRNERKRLKRNGQSAA